MMRGQRRWLCLAGWLSWAAGMTGLAWGQEKEYDFVKPQHVVVLSAEQPGVLLRIAAEPQDFVRAGELLVQLDPNLVELEIAKTEAQLRWNTDRQKAIIRRAYAQENFDIVDQLFETQIGSTRVGSPKERSEAAQVLDLAGLEATDALREFRLLEIALQQWHKRRAQMQLRAPWDGVVVSFTSVKPSPQLENAKRPEVGESVQVGQPLAALMKVDRLRVPWWIEVNQLERVRLGQPVRVYVPEDTAEPLAGELVFISPTVDSANRVALEVEFANPPARVQPSGPPARSWYPYRLRPGMSARVDLGTSSAVPVPSSAPAGAAAQP